jgi:3-hydroxyisobutyrate dehydrogenase-like beta-hydroxyacid dehydrogenase
MKYERQARGMNDKVTVIGAGRMGSALAAVLFQKGFETTVWNRTGAKTEALQKLGLSVATILGEAVRDADIVVISLSDYGSARQLLRQAEIEAAFLGKIVVQLSSGTPQEARELDSWARRCGISYLDGAILASPAWIGTPACAIFYTGPGPVFERAKPVLMAFGERSVFVGNEIGHAAAFDVAVLTFGVSAMLGFLQGQVVWESENLPAGGFLETIKGMMPTMESLFTDMSRRIASKNYTGDQASLEAYSVVTKQLVSWCEDRGSDHTIADACVNLMERAIQAGKSQDDFACLFEILAEAKKKPI